MKGKAVITGAVGFIGGHLVQSLKTQGYSDIRAVDQKPLDDWYQLDAPKGVRGRNSDNTLIRELLGWAPSISLREGLEKTYAWIYDEIKAGKTGKGMRPLAMAHA